MKVNNLKLNWSFGNAKLKKTGTVSFNLPAKLACPGAQSCIADCYALQGRFLMPSVMRPRTENFENAKRADFHTKLIHDLAILARKGVRSIRVHDSGDFFNQRYLDSWVEACALFPSVQFYAYTKSHHLKWNALPANLKVTQSFGGRFDSRIDKTRSHAVIFASHEERRKAGYVDGNQDDRHAQKGTVKIGLVYHGTKRMSDKLKAQGALV